MPSSLAEVTPPEVEMSSSMTSDSDQDLSGTAPSSLGSISGDEEMAKQHIIHLPDTFSSIMSVKPVINQHYSKVKLEAEAWIAEVYQLNEKQARKNAKADFSYMNAIWAPYADADSLRLMIDWHHWVFAFDDQFDEGHLNEDPIKAADEIIRTLALMDDTHPIVTAKEDPVRHVFQTTWYRIRDRSSDDLQQRYKRAVREYCLGVLGQVGVRHQSTVISVDQYMDFRRSSIGTYPSFALVEAAHGIQIHQSIIDHPSIRQCEVVSSDLVVLVNDLLSYRKDIEQGVDHNIITLLKGQGFSTQEAVDKVGEMLDNCYKTWYRALAQLPIWGEKVDREVLRYLDACRNVALGNLHWSYWSGRYLGDEGQRVRETRILPLPTDA